MAGFNIGVNALRAAAQQMQVASDNVANANTEGYHVKRATVTPISGPSIGGVRIGLGCTVQDVSRVRDELIEYALLMHSQFRARFGAEAGALANLETFLNEPTDAGLDAQLGKFFESLAELAGTPDDMIVREKVVWSAQAVCDVFNHLDAEFRNIADSLLNVAGLAVENINALTERIAELNLQIKLSETGGTSAPTLKDVRDQLITELSELVNVTVYEEAYGVVNVSCAGTLLVSGAQNSELELVTSDEGMLIRRSGAVGHQVDVCEGSLAGTLQVANNLLPRYQSILADLADSFRRAINLVHSTGLGSNGRFDRLEGLNLLTSDTPLCDLGYGVPSGTSETLVINVEDEATGDVTQYELTLDTTQAANVFITSLRDDINASVPHVAASVDNGRLVLQADDGYAFGFATPYDPNPAQPGDITAASPTSPTIMDAYAGDRDLVYEFSFLNGGEIGVDTMTVQIDVREPSGPLLRTLTHTIDETYDPGAALELENGLKYSLGAGNVAAADGFSFTARASMDTAGVLDALGLNVLFTGLSAASIRVADPVRQDPANLAIGISEAPGDNHRLLEMIELESAEIAASGSATLHDYYRIMLGEIATTRNTRDLQYQTEDQLVNDLKNQRDAVSGVSVDEEMINLMAASTIYQGALRLIKAIDDSLDDLATLV